MLAMPAAKTDGLACFALQSVSRIQGWDLRLGFGHWAWASLVWAPRGSAWSHGAYNTHHVTWDPRHTAAAQHRWSCKEQGGHFVKKQLMLGNKWLDIAGIYMSLQNLPCPEPSKKMQVTVRARKKGKKGWCLHNSEIFEKATLIK